MQQTHAGINNGTSRYIDYRHDDVVGAWRIIAGTDWVLISEHSIISAFDDIDTRIGNCRSCSGD